MIILYTLKLNKVFNRMPNFNLINSESSFAGELLCFIFVLSLSLCLPGWPRTQRSTCPDSQVLKLKVHTSMPSYSNLCIQTFHSLYFAVSPELPTHCPGVLLPSYRKLPVAFLRWRGRALLLKSFAPLRGSVSPILRTVRGGS